MGLLESIWASFEAVLFPNTPKLQERRQLKKLETSLRRNGTLARSGSTLSGKWAKHFSDFSEALTPFRAIIGRTFGSHVVPYRQALSRRFWEESFGLEFLEQRNQLTYEVLKRRLLQFGLNSEVQAKIEQEIELLLDTVSSADPLPPSQEWNALYWFSEVVQFPFETVLHPWGGARHNSGSFRDGVDPTPLLSSFEELYLALGAVDASKNLDRGIVRFWSGFTQDEGEIAEIYGQIQKARGLLVGPCNPVRLRDLIRWVTKKCDANPRVGRQDSQWFQRNVREFEATLRADFDRAAAEVYQAWLDNEIKKLFGPSKMLTTVGYTEAESEVLRKSVQVTLALVKPLVIFKTFYFGMVRLKLVPLLRELLLKGTFADKGLNQNLTQWIYRAEALEEEFRQFEVSVVDGNPGSWPHISAMMQNIQLRKNGGIQREVEILNSRVLDFITPRLQDLVNLLELGVILETDRVQNLGSVQNWGNLTSTIEGLLETMPQLPDTARAFFRIMKAYVPVHSSLLE